ncbi:MAG: sigma-70 family RNA polymerase sigma factor [Sedimentisphaerales bacterium]|nr:sigma-70 family RNA polymerase sigma factor [Sedimentisphaerales bacterium]
MGQRTTENVGVNDSVLVELSRQGDSEATERLILKYQHRIYNVILRMCGNVDDAAELTQDTFVKVIKNIGNFQARSSFYTWLFRIAVNLTLNYCQRDMRLSISSLDTQIDSSSGKPRQTLKELLADDSSIDPSAVAANKELCRLLIQMLMNLDESMRVLIVLRDIEGMNYAQIAQILGLELGTVKSRLSRARNALREKLEAFL